MNLVQIKVLLRILIIAISVCYPLLVFCSLVLFGLHARGVAALLLLICAVQIFESISKKNATNSVRVDTKVAFIKNFAVALLTLFCAIFAIAFDSEFSLKFYPVIVNVSLLIFFTYTLFTENSFAFRMACIADKKLATNPVKDSIKKYCDKVTFAWCIFFVFNALVALYTSIACSTKIWSIYNGLISYILIGLFFAIEFIIRKGVQKKMLQYIPVYSLEKSSREMNSIVSFDENSVKTWSDFISDVSKVRCFIENFESREWILNCEDQYYFTVAFIAMLQGKRKALITANRQESFIKEIKRDHIRFLTDAPFENADLIQNILQNENSDGRWNSFDANEAEFVLYTSGTTGKPKMVSKRFSQFDTPDLLKLWGSLWVNRKVYSTVNHHHVYGLSVAVVFALATGLPFCRRRIDYPNELENILDENIILVSSPAFLKRLAANTNEKLKFKKVPIVYSSAGALPIDVAQKCNEILGYWPHEIYGSTETGGMATRQSINGPEWTPMFSCKVSVAENGCLNVKSPYVLEPEGFTTGDLIDIYSDGRFLLKGRSDSIVKIEEKRISLPEVESRIKSTGFVEDVCVVAIEKKRQYLAAAIVFNESGKSKFKDLQKLKTNEYFKKYLSGFLENTVIPKKWRYLEELPQDIQGKIKKSDIKALFSIPENKNFRILKMQRDSEIAKVKLMFPASSDFYDGHFTNFKLLPAVAQVDVTVTIASALLNSPRTIKRILRTKFVAPIIPDTNVELTVSYNADLKKISFTYKDENKAIMSSGNFIAGDDA